MLKKSAGRLLNPNYYADLRTFVCTVCKKEDYQRSNTINKYCGRACQAEGQKTAIVKSCKVCKKDFKAYLSKIKDGRAVYCSKECSKVTNFKNGHTPWHKGETGVYSEEQLARITEANRAKAWKNSGEKCHLWKGGITPDIRKQRVEFADKVSPLVFARDNYTCQICDQYGGMLHADHIKSWADYPELRFDIDNCRTLCRPCHYYVTFKKKLPIGSKWGMMATNYGGNK